MLGVFSTSLARLARQDFFMEESLQPGVLIDLAEDENGSQVDVQDFLQPLQDTADRVSEQVEAFARSLHKFRIDQSVPEEQRWRSAYALLTEFRNATGKRLDRTTSTGSSPQDADHQPQVEKLALEQDLWNLAYNMLTTRSPETLEMAQLSQSTKLKDLHRYSSSPDVWNAFLDCDPVSLEYEAIMTWLQERAGSAEPGIKNKSADILRESERGEICSATSLFTSHEIKNRKRLLARSGPLEAAPTGSLTSHLDPDAARREGTHLEVRDARYEEAAWITCWEMLRRGMNFNDIRKWWSGTNEPYRTALLRPSTTDSSYDSPFLRIMNISHNSQWYRLCGDVARDPSISNPTQRAVFGLLAGDSGVAEKACATIDDHSFVLINSLLIERYMHFVEAYHRKLAHPAESDYQPTPGDRTRLIEMLGRMSTDEQLSQELREPHRYLEMAILTLDMGEFLIEIGEAISDISAESGTFDHLIRPISSPSTDLALKTASDEDSIRILAHLQILLNDLGFFKANYQHNIDMVENNLVSYIGYLQRLQKWTLLPIYASKLSPRRAHDVLGATLIDIANDKERAQLVRLMHQYSINVPETLFNIAVKANNFKPTGVASKDLRLSASRITERVAKGQVKIRSELMDGDLTEEEDKAIAGVEWYRYIDAKNWGRACWSISSLYKMWLIQGRFCALKALLERASLADTSLAALSMNLSFGSDSDDEDADGDQNMVDNPEDTGETDHILTAKGEKREELYSKSFVWLQLEQLVHVLVLLQDWQYLSDEWDA